ncbi:hypothetical protein RhiirA4_463842 [Rhizophagus irregularis]|uniref:Uncharacterized protein n=1 Tax=Rhizophagus irregularis TaxID=588596 RepID=A0A2I1GNR7_9GLOM|nr:hypothetical protein RhiirA4_463842 [Rhizophagus irregularis]
MHSLVAAESVSGSAGDFLPAKKKRKKCWQHEPNERSNIQQVISELNGIDLINPTDPESNNENITTGGEVFVAKIMT